MGIGGVHTGLWWGNLREEDHLKDSSVEGRIILQWVFEKWDGGVDWTDLVQDRYRWRLLL
jgi:hypothetical protein